VAKCCEALRPFTTVYILHRNVMDKLQFQGQLRSSTMD